MKKIILVLLIIVCSLMADIVIGRYTDDFGDATGNLYMAVNGSVDAYWKTVGSISVGIFH